MSVARLQRLLHRAGMHGECRQTEHAGHATALASEAAAAGHSIVVAVGGDGTVNETARGLLHTTASLGIIPRGSGNGLARHLQIPLRAEKALALIKAGGHARIDSGTINGHPFFCTAGIGFDAFISSVFAGSKKRGLLTYARLTLANFMDYLPTKACLKLNGEQLETTIFVIAFANASQYGNNAYIAPMADIQDGFLDVCLIRELNFRTAAEVGFGLWRKSLASSRVAQYFRTNQVLVELAEPCSYHADGDFVGKADSLRIELFPLSLQVIQPGAVL